MPRDSEEPRIENVRGEENIDPAAPEKPSSTIYPPPVHFPRLSLIERYLHLTTITPTTFTNTHALWHPPGARGIYGGEIIGQSIVAAASTVPSGLWLHSIHAYFVLAGDANLPLTYDVADIRTGRSFATRQVKAIQNGKPIFILMASFQKPVPKERIEKGAVVMWQVEMPKVPAPGEVLSEEQKIKKGEEIIVKLKERIERAKIENNKPEVEKDEALLKHVELAVVRRKRRLDRDPFEWRKLPSTLSETEPYSTQKICFWVRSRSRLTSPSSPTPIPHIQLAALSYFTDNWFIGTVGRVNPAAGGENLSMIVSLDHTVYFHLGPETKVDDYTEGRDDEGWLLVEMDARWVGEERGVVTQRVWREKDRKLVATCVQEGLLRLREGSVRVGERGEEGIVIRKKLDSKL